MGVYKIHISIESRVNNHSDTLIKPEKIETKSILIDEKKS